MQTLNSIEQLLLQTVGQKKDPIIFKFPKGGEVKKQSQQVLTVQDQADRALKTPKSNDLNRILSARNQRSVSMSKQSIHSFYYQSKKQSVHQQPVMSDIKVVSQFTENKEFSENQFSMEPSNVSSIMLEQSLRSDLRVWEQICDVDKTVVNEVEKGFIEIDGLIQQLAGQFDVCFNLQKKADAQFQDFWQLVKGTTFTKFSRSNPKKTMVRVVYYCPYQEAVCWREITARHAKQTQMIPISSILSIHTSAKRYKSLKKNFLLREGQDPECFLGIEAKKGVSLELLANDQQTRNLFARYLEQLMANQGKGVNNTEANFLMTQHGHDVNQLRRNLDTTKRYYQIAIEKLKQQFIQTAQKMLQQEKQKRGQLRKEQKNIILKNKATLEELLAENDQLHKLLQEQQQKNQPQNKPQVKSIDSVEMMKLNQVIHSIVALNGELSIHNESVVDDKININLSLFQDCLQQLESLRMHMDKSQNLEVSLRQQITDLEQKIYFWQTTNNEKEAEYQQVSSERDELLQNNEELAIKLNDLHNQIESKEQQFKEVVYDMRTLQSKVQVLLAQQCSQEDLEALQNENNRLKNFIQQKLNGLKDQMLEEEQENLKLIANFTVLLSYLCVPSDLNLSPEQVLKSIIHQITKIANGAVKKYDTMRSPSTNDSVSSQSDEERLLYSLSLQLEKKANIYLQRKEFRENFLEQLRSGLLSMRYLSLKTKFNNEYPPTSPSLNTYRDKENQQPNQRYLHRRGKNSDNFLQ